MTESYGYVGKILRVDLSTGKLTDIPITKYAPKFIGGRGIGAKIIWDEVPSEVGALDPENRLIFMTGPVTGTLIPSAARIECMFKSPQTYPVEGYAWSGAGGFWGPELKYAGYDGIIIQGKADCPVYLWIFNGQTDILPARFLWSTSTFDAQRELMRRHGEKTRVLAIGAAGENLCRNATVQTESGNAFGEGGSGGVMGSKNLKAIAVRGTGPVNVPDMKEHMKIANYLTSLKYEQQTKPLIKGPGTRLLAGGPTGTKMYEEGLMGTARIYASYCAGCQTCGPEGNTAVAFHDDPYLSGAAMCVEATLYIMPEKIYYGGKLGGRVAWYATMLSQALGINAYEFFFRLRSPTSELCKPPYPSPPDGSGGGDWLYECYLEGLFNETNTGLPWDKFGSKEFIEALLRGVACRQGKFLKLLGECVGRTAGYIRDYPQEFDLTPKQGAKVWMNYQKHYARGGKFGGYPAHWTRDAGGQITPQGMMCCALNQRDFSTGHDPQKIVAAPGGDEQRKKRGKLLFGDEKALFYVWDGDICWSSKGKVTKYCEIQTILRDSLVFCDYNMYYYDVYTKDREGDLNAPAKMFNSVTGLQWSEAELEKAAERCRTLERAISVREGRSREDDVLFNYWIDEPDSMGRRVDRAKLKRAMDEYYAEMGYDLIMGRPTKARLIKLGLGDVAQELEKHGKLS